MKVNLFNLDKKYNIIYADPPWSYDDKTCKGNCEIKYSTLTVPQLAELPIKRLAAKDSILFIWATYPKLREALKTIEAWGFKYKTIAFQWVKLNRRTSLNQVKIMSTKEFEKSCFFGLGRWTRGNTECCLLDTKGKPKRKSACVGQLVFSPLKKHSSKPPEVREKILQLMGDFPRIELFAREQAEGWDCWGNEC